MILMLNCSLKSKEGNTQYFLERVKERVGECEIVQIKEILKGEMEAFAEKLSKSDALVIGAPLYVDGLPAQAVKLLEVLLDEYKGKLPNLPVYVVSNLGFYEAEQIRHLLDMVRNWCARMGCVYGGGLAVGAGPMMSILKDSGIGRVMNQDVNRGLDTLAGAIKGGKAMENYYTKTKIPRAVYLMAAHANFRKTLKGNGVYERNK